MTRFYSNTGKPVKFLKKLVYCPNTGVKKLEICGLENFYDNIQSHRDSTDFAILRERFDDSQILGASSTYSFKDLLDSPIIDVTSLPKNAGEMLNLIQTGKNLFDGLPLEIREAFNFSSQKFISTFGTKDFADTINRLNASLNGDMTPIFDVSSRGKISRHIEESLNDSIDSNITNGGEV